MRIQQEIIERYLKIKTLVPHLKSKTSIALLLFLIICGFILRFYHLGAQSLWTDEAISANAAIAMLKHGTPTFPSGVVYMRAILNTFFISLSFMIFGVSEFSARFPSVIFGTLTIPLVYVMGTRLGNRKIGLIAALFVTFSVMEIAWSRQARMYQQLQFFYLASLYFFYEFNFNDNKSKRNLNLALTIIFFVCAVLTHVFGYVLILVFGLYFLIVHFEEIKFKWKESVDIKHIAGLFISILMIFFILKFMGSDLLDVISYLFRDIDRIERGEYLEVYLYVLRTELSVFFYLAIIGALLSFKIKKNWKSGLLLIMSFVIPFYFLSCHVLVPATRYLYFIFPLLLIFSAYFFAFLIELAQKYSEYKNKSAKIKSTLIALVICAMLIAMAFSPQGFMIAPREEFDLGINAPQPDFKKAYCYVKENMQSNDVIIDSWPTVALFYMGKSDYWLAFEVDGIGLGIDRYLVNNGSNEMYANAMAIKNVDMLKEVVGNHDRGWIVLDNTAWIRISPGIKKYIKDEMQYCTEASDETIRVYSWGR